MIARVGSTMVFYTTLMLGLVLVCWASDDIRDSRKFLDHLAYLAKLPPVPCREHFALMAQRYFYQEGAAAEVGVFQGDFAEANLRTWTGRYFAIDAWRHRGDGSFDKNVPAAWWHLRNMRHAKRNVEFAGNRSRLIRRFSTDAALLFPHHFFDWIFIDALHTENAVLEDLHAWWPKLRPGGLLSGDDYVDINSTELLPANRITGHAASSAKEHQFGVVRATRAFAAKVGAILSITFLNRGINCKSTPAWYMVKPP